MASDHKVGLELHCDSAESESGAENERLLGTEGMCVESTDRKGSVAEIDDMDEYCARSMELRPQENGNVQFILIDSDLSSEDEARDELVEITEADIEKASMNVLVDHGEFPDYDPDAKKHFEEWILVDVNKDNYKVTMNLLQESSVYNHRDRLCCVVQ